ncbi:MAG: hypothetical protein EXR73_08515 [Myxococcales bacterium]|nr:hypothetical protein [Myxococcales bacterium]
MPRAAAALALALALLLAGCAPSGQQIRRARSVEYTAEYARVWNAVVAAVRAHYPRLVVEDAIRGRLRTDWHLIERVPAVEADQPDGGKFFRVDVAVRGFPTGPWRVEVDGEAAEYKPNLALIIPFVHGVADEPTWVGPRIDRVHVDVLKKLEQYAAVRASLAPAPKAHTGRWAALPQAAARVVADVHAAAEGGDLASLGPRMASDFVWSLGGAPSLEQALALWSADPARPSALRRVLEAGCAHDAASATVVCPATPAEGGLRAEFRLVGGRWRFTAFHEVE